MGILLKPEEITELHMEREPDETLGEFYLRLRDAQHRRDVDWLRGKCPHHNIVGKVHDIRHECPTCFWEFVAAGSEGQAAPG